MFSKMKLTTRLNLLNVTVAFFTLALVVVGYSMVTRMSSSVSDMYNRGLVGSKLLSDDNNAVWELRFGIANYTLVNPENRKNFLEGRPKQYGVLEESSIAAADRAHNLTIIMCLVIFLLTSGFIFLSARSIMLRSVIESSW